MSGRLRVTVEMHVPDGELDNLRVALRRLDRIIRQELHDATGLYPHITARVEPRQDET